MKDYNLKTWICIVLLIILPLITYWNMFDNYFLLDDVGWVGSAAQFVRDGEANNISYYNYAQEVFYKQASYAYRPMFRMYIMALSSFFYLDFFYYGLSNFLLHVSNILLLFFIINILTKNKFFSVMVAGLFSVSTVYQFAVLQITTSCMLLFSFFFLLSLIFFILYTQKKKIYFYILSFVFFISALLTYEAAISLIFILYLYYILTKKRSAFNYIIKPLVVLIPFLLFFLYYLYLKFLVFSTGYILRAEVMPRFGNMDISITNLIFNCARYIVHMFHPSLYLLHRFYPFLDFIEIRTGNPYASLITKTFLAKIPQIDYILIGVVFVVSIILFIKGKKWTKFFLAWMWISILPFTIFGIQGHYVYLASMGAYFLLMSFIFYFYRKIKKFNIRILNFILILLIILFFVVHLYVSIPKIQQLEKRMSSEHQAGIRNTLLKTFNSENISNEIIYFHSCGNLPFVFLESIFDSELAEFNLTARCIHYEMINNKTYYVQERPREEAGHFYLEELIVEDVKYFISREWLFVRMNQSNKVLLLKP